jgi:hypothetical protein
MPAVNLGNKPTLALIDLQKGILGLPTAVPPKEIKRQSVCRAVLACGRVDGLYLQGHDTTENRE